MHIVLRLKFQSDFVVEVTTLIKRSDEHTKERLGSLTQMFIRYYTISVVVDKRWIAYEKWVHRFSWTQKNKTAFREREGGGREQRQTLILTFSFLFIALLRICSLLLTSRLRVWAPNEFFFSFFLSLFHSSNEYSVLISSSQSELVVDLQLIHFYF